MSRLMLRSVPPVAEPEPPEGPTVPVAPEPSVPEVPEVPELVPVSPEGCVVRERSRRMVPLGSR